MSITDKYKGFEALDKPINFYALVSGDDYLLSQLEKEVTRSVSGDLKFENRFVVMRSCSPKGLVVGISIQSYDDIYDSIDYLAELEQRYPCLEFSIER